MSSEKAAKKAAKRELKVANRAQTLPRSWALARRSWGGLRAHWKLYVGIAAVVELPVGLLGLLPGVATDSNFAAYSTLALLAMITALVYAIRQVRRGQPPASIRAAYYEGSALIVRYALVAAAVIVLAIPAGYGLYLTLITASSADFSVANDVMVVSIVFASAIVISIPSLWLVPRFVMSVYVAAWEGLAPWAALRRGRALTLGRYWRVLARLVAGVVLALAAAIVMLLPTALIRFVWAPAADPVYSILVSVLVLPWLTLYMVNLYLALTGEES